MVAIAASNGRNPQLWRASSANATIAVSTVETARLVPSSRLKPIAAPRNSARSVAIAITSAWIHRSTEVRFENSSRQTSGRFRPVAIPSFAESVWMTIAMRLAATTTQRSR